MEQALRPLVVALTVLVALLAATPAQAHDARPLAVSVVEQAPNVYRAVIQAPPTLSPADAPRILWPESCEAAGSDDSVQAQAAVTFLTCPQGMAGSVIAIDYPGANPSLSTLIRITHADGRTSTAVLPPDVAAWTVPAEPDWRSVMRDYIALGFVHIWEGPDHLMFVAGLLLLARAPRRILLAVTGFTAAHSITLSLATLGLVRVPIAPVEALIALSILFLAAELARNDASSFSRRFPIALSFTFGLLHGFGFASALGEVGLPQGEIALGLVGFNVGVELGQIAFVALAGAVVLLWRLASPLGGQGVRSLVDRRGVVAGAYLLGAPAALWFFERSAAALGV